jgi:hypothetical protein
MIETTELFSDISPSYCEYKQEFELFTNTRRWHWLAGSLARLTASEQVFKNIRFQM